MKRETIGIILLSRDGFYLREDGSLPDRPAFDKTLLLHLVKNKVILCSMNTHRTLPGSVLNACKSVTTNETEEWDINLGILTFRTAPPDLMYVIRSELDMLSGKKFRDEFFKNYQPLTYENESLSIYRRI